MKKFSYLFLLMASLSNSYALLGDEEEGGYFYPYGSSSPLVSRAPSPQTECLLSFSEDPEFVRYFMGSRGTSPAPEELAAANFGDDFESWASSQPTTVDPSIFHDSEMKTETPENTLKRPRDPELEVSTKNERGGKRSKIKHNDSDHKDNKLVPIMHTAEQPQIIEEISKDLRSGSLKFSILLGDNRPQLIETACQAASVMAECGKKTLFILQSINLARNFNVFLKNRFEEMNVPIIYVPSQSELAPEKLIQESRNALASSVHHGIFACPITSTFDVLIQNLGLVVVNEDKHVGPKRKEKIGELSKGAYVLWIGKEETSQKFNQENILKRKNL